jgi:hypothetical protein
VQGSGTKWRLQAKLKSFSVEEFAVDGYEHPEMWRIFTHFFLKNITPYMRGNVGNSDNEDPKICKTVSSHVMNKKGNVYIK